MAGGRLHVRSRILAGTARRRDRVHDEAVEIGGLIGAGPYARVRVGLLSILADKLIENITLRPANPIAISQQRPPVVDNGKSDGQPKLNGWVPGRFLLRCSCCDEKYQGDRKSRSCADCAYGCREAASA